MLRSESRRANGGWASGGGAAHSQFTASAADRQAVLRFHGRTIAKLVVAQPLDQLVVGMPYRYRQTVEHPSLPPVALAYARQAGCGLWIVRDDQAGECYAVPIAEVGPRGWLKPHRDGHPEWFVPLARFEPVAWQDWPWLPPEQAIDLDKDEPAARQLSLFEVLT